MLGFSTELDATEKPIAISCSFYSLAVSLSKGARTAAVVDFFLLALALYLSELLVF